MNTEITGFITEYQEIKLEGCQNALFDGELMETVHLKDVRFSNCSFQECKIFNSIFENVTFENCRFYGCEIKLTSFKNCRFLDCTSTSRYVMCDMTGTVFRSLAFRRGYFHHCQWDLNRFESCQFDGMQAFCGKYLILSKPVFDGCKYTMGGATDEEAAYAEETFFHAFDAD